MDRFSNLGLPLFRFGGQGDARRKHRREKVCPKMGIGFRKRGAGRIFPPGPWKNQRLVMPSEPHWPPDPGAISFTPILET